jgi:hypothetical protein
MTPPATDGRPRSGRRTLVLIALVAIAPFGASYVAYYAFPRDRQTNYGELLPTGPAPDVGAVRPDGTPYRLAHGKWLLVFAAGGACDALCNATLYASRQARTMQNREMNRVERVWLVTDGVSPAPALLAEHPDLTVLQAPPAGLAPFGAGADRLYLVDPLGNLVLAYPREPDVKGLAKDVERLLKASRIG